MTSVLFLGKMDDVNTEKAADFCCAEFQDVTAFLAGWNTPIPCGLANDRPDYIISYLSRWIIPECVLKNARIAAINFHPAPPEYPGFAPNNFALYEGAKEFGVTCHHMKAKVDTGPIVAVRRFPLLDTDTIASLQERTYKTQLTLFHDVMHLILQGVPLPTTDEKWKEKAYTRKQFNQLNEITTDMSPGEVARRIRATSFGKFQPFIELHGNVFELKAK